MDFIKTNSSYVHRTKHSLTKDGIIFERDITTLGGLNLFSSTQVPVYTSGNFIISVDGTTPVKKKIEKINWEVNGESEIWTLDSIINNDENQNKETSNENEIILRKDFYRLQDFAYYGSLYELVKSSMSNIINKFPGELYAVYVNDDSEGKRGYNVHFTSNTTYDFCEYILGREDMDGNTEGSGGFEYLVSNPFSINLHVKQPHTTIKEPQKYFFLDNHWENYEVITADGVKYDCADLIINYTPSPSIELLTQRYGENFIICKGDYLCEISFIDNTDGKLFTLRAYIGNNDSVYYLTTFDYLGVHVRPKECVYNDFIDNCSVFEAYLLNKKESKNSDNIFYKATFEVIRENEQGYTKTLEDFLLPLDSSKYNIDISSPAYTTYINALASIGTYYDEHFTDNLYRSMTHESIKNFDWTYTREFVDGEEEEYIIGGTRISNILHLFAREFDEIKSYIDYLKYINVVTYDCRNNLPNYFLSDLAECKGWDLVTICPYTLNEYYLDDNEEKIFDFNHEQVDEPNNVISIGDTSKKIYRLFYQNTDEKYSDGEYSVIQPYKVNSCLSAGSFVYCDCDGGIKEERNTDVYRRLKHTDCLSFLRLMPYFNNDEYGVVDIYNTFLHRLCLNTPSIFTKKGTIEGIEAILSMFGMKSQRWVDSLSKHAQQKSVCSESESDLTIEKDTYYIADYDIKEYTTFTKGLYDFYNNNAEVTWINWYNTTKMLPYEFQEEYEGLPISYEPQYLLEEEIVSNQQYNLLSDEEKEQCEFIGNIIYPYFGKKIDGDPYYQMFGGWMAKDGFTFDKNNNIVLEGDKENEDIRNCTLFTETHSHLRAVDDITGIQSFIPDDMHDGDILYVESFKEEFVVIDGYEFYPIKSERLFVYATPDATEKTCVTYQYFNYVAKPESCSLGDTVFTNILYISNPAVYDREIDGIQTINLNELTSDLNVKVYLNGNKEDGYSFVMSDGTYEILDRHISYFLNIDGNYKFVSYLEDGEEDIDEIDEKKYTNYFILHDKDNCNFYDSDFGWEQLADDDTRYYKLNTIIEKNKGNNPHAGHAKYDMGTEYIEYFHFLFKYALENDLINEDCYFDNLFEDHKDIMSQIGFNKMMITNSEDSDTNIEYGYLEQEDSKVHSFCNIFENELNSSNADDSETIYFRNVIGNLCKNLQYREYGGDNGYHLTEIDRISNQINPDSEKCYGLTDEGNEIEKIDDVIGTNDEVIVSGLTASDNLNQIINTKRVDIIFYMYTNEEDKYSIKGLEERKYIDGVILPYLEQMIPSNIICRIIYQYSNEVSTIKKRYSISIKNPTVNVNWDETSVTLNLIKTIESEKSDGTFDVNTFEDVKIIPFSKNLSTEDIITNNSIKFHNALASYTIIQSNCKNIETRCVPDNIKKEVDCTETKCTLTYSLNTYYDNVLTKQELKSFVVNLNSANLTASNKVINGTNDGVSYEITHYGVKYSIYPSNIVIDNCPSTTQTKTITYTCQTLSLLSNKVIDSIPTSETITLTSNKTEGRTKEWNGVSVPYTIIKDNSIVTYRVEPKIVKGVCDWNTSTYEIKATGYTIIDGVEEDDVTLISETIGFDENTSENVLHHKSSITYEHWIVEYDITQNAKNPDDEEKDYDEGDIDSGGITHGAEDKKYPIQFYFPNTIGTNGVNVWRSFTSTGWAVKSFGDGGVGKTFTKLKLHEGFKVVDDNTFIGCDNFTEVTFPSTLYRLGKYAFKGLTNLTSVTFTEFDLSKAPSYKFFMNDGVFYGCGITEIDFPKNIKRIPNETFRMCGHLQKVTLPDDIQSIGKYAFQWCGNVETITIPDSVTNIDDYAFHGCRSLTSVTYNKKEYVCLADLLSDLTSNNVTYGSKTFELVSLEDCDKNENYLIKVKYSDGTSVTSDSKTVTSEIVFDNDERKSKKVRSVELKEGVTSIGNDAFLECTGLTSIDIPNSVTSIGKQAFRNCYGLTSLVIPNNVTNIDDNAFYNCTNIESINIPNGIITINSGVFEDCNSLKSIIIPDGVTSVGNFAFEHCTSLTSIIIPNSVTKLGTYTLMGCASLTSITLSDNITSIGNNAFFDCQKLVAVKYKNIKYTCKDTILQALKSNGVNIGENIFHYCESFYDCSRKEGDDDYTIILTFIDGSVIKKTDNVMKYQFIPDKDISNDNSTLVAVELLDGVTEISSQAFYNCLELTSVTIPNTVTKIHDGAFGGCTKLKSLIIPDSVTLLGYNVAYDSTGLEELVIGNGVNVIYSQSFRGCTNLKTVTLGNSLTRIETTAFSNCTNLQNITIPNKVTSIGPYAFSNCLQLSNVTMSNSVVSLGKCTFQLCKSLTSITLSDNITVLPEDVFYSCEKLQSINIPASTTNLERNAIGSCSALTSITMSPNLTIIGDSAFINAKSLQTIEFPDNLTQLGERALGNCTSLTSVTYQNVIYTCLENLYTALEDNHVTIGDLCFTGTTHLDDCTSEPIEEDDSSDEDEEPSFSLETLCVTTNQRIFNGSKRYPSLIVNNSTLAETGNAIFFTRFHKVNVNLNDITFGNLDSSLSYFLVDDYGFCIINSCGYDNWIGGYEISETKHKLSVSALDNTYTFSLYQSIDEDNTSFLDNGCFTNKTIRIPHSGGDMQVLIGTYPYTFDSPYFYEEYSFLFYGYYEKGVENVCCETQASLYEQSSRFKDMIPSITFTKKDTAVDNIMSFNVKPNDTKHYKEAHFSTNEIFLHILQEPQSNRRIYYGKVSYNNPNLDETYSVTQDAKFKYHYIFQITNSKIVSSETFTVKNTSFTNQSYICIPKNIFNSNYSCDNGGTIKVLSDSYYWGDQDYVVISCSGNNVNFYFNFL